MAKKESEKDRKHEKRETLAMEKREDAKERKKKK